MNLKLKNGITIISLVITIILLLIFATLTINFIIGDASLFEKAELGKAKYENSAEQEEQELAKLDSYIDQNIKSNSKISFTEDELNGYVQNKINEAITPVTYEGTYYTIVKTGKMCVLTTKNVSYSLSSKWTKYTLEYLPNDCIPKEMVKVFGAGGSQYLYMTIGIYLDTDGKFNIYTGANTYSELPCAQIIYFTE